MSNIKTIIANSSKATKVSKKVTVNGGQYSYIITLSFNIHIGLDGKKTNCDIRYNAVFAHNNKPCCPANVGKKTLLNQIDIYENKAPKGMFL